jgi:lysozyme family protein
MNTAALVAANAARWSKVRVHAAKQPSFRAVARRLVAARERYQAVSVLTGVPWYVIAVIHEREASQRWDASIAQGDPWARVSTHVPKGRGPFVSWQAAAVDALTNCAPYAAKWKDWSPGGIMTLLEQYNGLGYANRGRPSPYIWAGTDQYVRGKYVADGKYDPNVVDSQPGCAGLLLAMAAIDASVADGLGQHGSAPPAAPAPAAKPSITNPAPGSLGAWIVALFKRNFS